MISFAVLTLDPNGRDLTARVTSSSKSFLVEFTPNDVGPHVIDVHFNNMVVPGSPYVCNVYNSSRVMISDVTPSPQMGKEIGFTVDSSKAGMGDVDVQVVCNNARIITQAKRISDNVFRHTFVAVHPQNHTATVLFNLEPVPGIFEISSKIQFVYQTFRDKLPS